MRVVDLNCDLGEGTGREAELMPLISSANIACGAHAGDLPTMRSTMKRALEHGVGVGAHPGYDDPAHFGRRELQLSAVALHELMIRQLSTLRDLGSVRHVKPHGALYNQAARDRAIADVLARAVVAVDPSLILFALAGSELSAAGRTHGLTVAEEVFGDRTYQPDGSLTPRSDRNALIAEATVACDQVLQMVLHGAVRSVSGTSMKISADTVCLHGDGDNAVSFAKAIRAALGGAGVQVRTFRP